MISIPHHSTDGTNSTFNGQRVYLASPIGTYWTSRYEDMLSRVRQQFPNADVLEPRHLFRSSKDWRLAWPDLLSSIDQLVFFGEPGTFWHPGSAEPRELPPIAVCTVGFGVYTEVTEAVANGIPAWYLNEAGRSFPFPRAERTDGDSAQRYYFRKLHAAEGAGNWTRYASVIPSYIRPHCDLQSGEIFAVAVSEESTVYPTLIGRQRPDALAELMMAVAEDRPIPHVPPGGAPRKSERALRRVGASRRGARRLSRSSRRMRGRG